MRHGSQGGWGWLIAVAILFGVAALITWLIRYLKDDDGPE